MSRAQDTGSVETDNGIKTILVVEDDPGIGSFLVEAIQQETPYQALLATAGYQALKIVHHIKPNLFLLDYGLPHINGIELYDQLHAIKELEDIPALLISARLQLPKREAQKREITCLKKPLELDELLKTIEGLLV